MMTQIECIESAIKDGWIRLADYNTITFVRNSEEFAQARAIGEPEFGTAEHRKFWNDGGVKWELVAISRAEATPILDRATANEIQAAKSKNELIKSTAAFRQANPVIRGKKAALAALIAADKPR